MNFPLLLLWAAIGAGVGDHGRQAVEPARTLSLAEVEKAVARGRAELLRRLEAILRNDPSDFPVGRLAFPVAALIKAGAAATEPPIAAALAKLEGLKVEKTYCAACYLMCLDALLDAHAGAPPAPGSTTGRPPTAPRESWLARLRQLADLLVRWQVSAVGAWTYAAPVKREVHDFSNTQFAVLGLEIGLKHGVKIPRPTFESLQKLLAGAITIDGPQEPVTITPEAPLEVKLGLTRVSADRKLRQAPGGWGYTDPRRGLAERDKPYPSMTAAGASSLKIALDALRRQGLTEKDAAPAEQALLSAYAWIARNFDAFLSDDRELFYTLYSLEKAGDVCRIERFGGRDWYNEGALKLLDRQRPNGGWGTYVETSLALLFLTRATRGLNPAAPPPILTGAKGQGGSSRDLVFIEKINGFLSARAVLEHAAATRRPELRAVCEEVVRNYAPDAKDELVPQLIALWGPTDAITAFARQALRTITAIEGKTREAFVQWEGERRDVAALEAQEDIAAASIRAAMEKTQSARLRGRLAGLAQRQNHRALAGFFVAEILRQESSEYRLRLHGILSLWTGADVAAPARDDKAGWDAAARAWETWWARHGARFAAP